MRQSFVILVPINEQLKGNIMRILTYSEARNNFKATLDSVIDDVDVAIIHRRDGEDAVLMGRDRYESLMETLYLTSSPANVAHLAKSIAQFKAGQTIKRELLDIDE